MDNINREREVYKVTIIGSIVNLILVIFKLTAGILGHSAAMIADAIYGFLRPTLLRKVNDSLNHRIKLHNTQPIRRVNHTLTPVMDYPKYQGIQTTF